MPRSSSRTSLQLRMTRSAPGPSSRTELRRVAESRIDEEGVVGHPIGCPRIVDQFETERSEGEHCLCLGLVATRVESTQSVLRREGVLT